MLARTTSPAADVGPLVQRIVASSSMTIRNGDRLWLENSIPGFALGTLEHHYSGGRHSQNTVNRTHALQSTTVFLSSSMQIFLSARWFNDKNSNGRRG